MAQTLLNHRRIRRRYSYPDAAIVEFCRGLARLAVVASEPPAIQVARDPDDDMILACAVAAEANYLVTRDKDLLVLGTPQAIRVVTPEAFLRLLSTKPPSL